MESEQRIRTLIVDDHPLYRLGLRMILSREPDIDVVGETGDPADAVLLAERLMVDVVLVDLCLPVMDGIALTGRLRQANPDCHIVALSAIQEPLQIGQVLDAGAEGYILKTQDTSEIVAAIRAVLGGVRYLPSTISAHALEPTNLGLLSAREREVLELLIDGRSNDDIATSLFVARRTVETHRQRIMKKLGAHTIADLVHVAARLGVVRA